MPEPAPAHDPAHDDERRPRAGRWSASRRVVWLVFGAFALFVFAHLLRLEGMRGPAAQLDALRPAVGAEPVDAAFDPTLHDRELELPPWLADDESGQPAPRTLRVADLGDRVIFLNFWATWCEPCVRELPSMFRLAHALRNQNFVMLAVSYDESWEDVSRFFRQHLPSFPPNFVLVRDPDQEAPLRAQYGTDKLPETYVLHRGRILDRFVNAHDWAAGDKRRYFDLVLALSQGR